MRHKILEQSLQQQKERDEEKPGQATCALDNFEAAIAPATAPNVAATTIAEPLRMLIRALVTGS